MGLIRTTADALSAGTQSLELNDWTMPTGEARAFPPARAELALVHGNSLTGGRAELTAKWGSKPEHRGDQIL